MEIKRYKAIKEVPSTIKGWEDFETIPKGAICNAPFWRGIERHRLAIPLALADG